MPFLSYEDAVFKTNASFLIMNAEGFLINKYRALADTTNVLVEMFIHTV